MPRGYIINTDPSWFEVFLSRASRGESVVHWQKSPTNPSRTCVVPGALLFHRVTKRNTVLGYGAVLRAEPMRLADAWREFGPAMGFAGLDEALTAAGRMVGKSALTPGSEVFVEVEADLRTCRLDLNADLLDVLGISYGTPPKYLPTRGQGLSEEEVDAIVALVTGKSSR